jgi:limonene-1,2-epoxide hydrolase
MTTDGGTILCNRLDTRVANSDALQYFMKMQMQSPDARSQVRMLPREIRIWVELGFLKSI